MFGRTGESHHSPARFQSRQTSTKGLPATLTTGDSCMSHLGHATTSLIATPIRRLAFLCSAVVLGIAVFAILSIPQRLEPGQVIDRYGTYRFPAGRRTLRIQKDVSGNVVVTVRHRAMRYRFIPYMVSNTLATFESERDWFISVDEYDRLWVYHGHWDRAWGPLRENAFRWLYPVCPCRLDAWRILHRNR